MKPTREPIATLMKKIFILIAEDDADDRFLLQTAFEEKGFQDKIEFVENGVELLKFLEKIRLKDSDEEMIYPAFIMLDLNMPKKSGREALQELKQHAVFKSIPVIVYTTTKNEMEIRRCYELGANSYIVKPARFEALLKVVEDIRNYWINTASIPTH
jgi:CheY-like chemotaxis protein